MRKIGRLPMGKFIDHDGSREYWPSLLHMEGLLHFPRYEKGRWRLYRMT
ncbi:MAG: hypothetical protein ACLFVU_14660 [Phycisphaerae bacterium]